MNLQEVLIEPAQTPVQKLPPVLYMDVPACLIVLLLVFMVVSLVIVILWYIATHPV
jgi:hypothetical protein